MIKLKPCGGPENRPLAPGLWHPDWWTSAVPEPRETGAAEQHCSLQVLTKLGRLLAFFHLFPRLSVADSRILWVLFRIPVAVLPLML